MIPPGAGTGRWPRLRKPFLPYSVRRGIETGQECAALRMTGSARRAFVSAGGLRLLADPLGAALVPGSPGGIDAAILSPCFVSRHWVVGGALLGSRRSRANQRCGRR